MEAPVPLRRGGVSGAIPELHSEQATNLAWNRKSEGEVTVTNDVRHRLARQWAGLRGVVRDGRTDEYDGTRAELVGPHANLHPTLSRSGAD